MSPLLSPGRVPRAARRAALAAKLDDDSATPGVGLLGGVASLAAGESAAFSTRATARATATGSGRVGVRLSRRQIARVRGGPIVLRYAVVDADGTRRTLTRAVRVR
jgi:hypothetical protein